jgi:hypothetical protein
MDAKQRREPEHRMQLFRITEYRDGQVFKTQNMGMVWVPDSVVSYEDECKYAKVLGGDLLMSLPTDFTSTAPYSECFRWTTEPRRN